MPAGLESWPVREAEPLFDDRLARRLEVTHFLVPPPKPEKGGPPGTTRHHGTLAIREIPDMALLPTLQSTEESRSLREKASEV